MKKSFLFFLLPFISKTQTDTIFKKDAASIVCNITFINKNSIFYTKKEDGKSIKINEVSFYSRKGRRIDPMHPDATITPVISNTKVIDTRIIAKGGVIVKDNMEFYDGVSVNEFSYDSYVLAVKHGHATEAISPDSIKKSRQELFTLDLLPLNKPDLKNASKKMVFAGFIDKTGKVKLVETLSATQFTFAKLNSPEFNKPVIKKLNDYGFNVSGDDEDVFEQKNKTSDLAVAAEIVYYTKETRGTPGYKISVAVRWTVYDVFRQENICKIITGGYSNTGQKLTEKEALINALLDASSGFIVSKEIQKAMSGNNELVKSRIKSISIVPVPVTVGNENYIQNAIQSAVTIQSKAGHGSGFLISTDGYIITNYHVIKDSTDLQAIFQNELVLPLQIISYDAKTDVALCKVPGKGYKPMAIDTSNVLKKIGIDVVTIGTPEDVRFGQTVTKGIISGVREINENVLIQTDVSINSGNSGGMLINKNGEVIGIIVSKIKKEGTEGLGFAIPVNSAFKALKITIVKKD